MVEQAQGQFGYRMVKTVTEKQLKELNQQSQGENYQHLQQKLFKKDKMLQQVYQEKDHVIDAMERRIQELNQQLTASRQATAQLQQTLLQREKVIQQLQEENQHLQQLTELSGNWKMCKTPDRAMHRGSSTVCGNMAYIRPGFTESGEVLSYDSDKDEWCNLPECRNLPERHRDCFTLTVVNGLVTAVGGRQSNQYTNTLLSFMENGGAGKWVEYFKHMPTKRSYTAVVCSGKALVVAGGEEEGDTVLRTVEVMDIDSQEWSTASRLPCPLSQASATVCGDKVYFSSWGERRTWCLDKVSVHLLSECPPSVTGSSMAHNR